MMSFSIHARHPIHPDSVDIFAMVTDQMGYLPNVLAQLGPLPHAVKAFVTLNQSFGAVSLTRLEQELVQITVSMENKSPYCVAAHTAFAQAADLPLEEVMDLRDGRPLHNLKHQTLVDYTRALVRTNGKPSPDSVNAFLAAGYTNEQMLEVVMGIAFKELSNLLANLTSPTLDKVFSPHVWTTTDPILAAE